MYKIALIPALFLAQLALPGYTTYLFERQPFVAEVTAYNAVASQTDSDPHITASGRKVNSLTAACPAFLSLGALITVNGELRRCDDRMNKRYREGNYFDILLPTVAEAREFGRQKREILLIDTPGQTQRSPTEQGMARSMRSYREPTRRAVQDVTT